MYKYNSVRVITKYLWTVVFDSILRGEISFCYFSSGHFGNFKICGYQTSNN